jgi:hypothetical protein
MMKSVRQFNSAKISKRSAYRTLVFLIVFSILFPPTAAGKAISFHRSKLTTETPEALFQPAAATITLSPAMDAWVDQGSPDSNYGSTSSLLMDRDAFNQLRIPLLFFQLFDSGIPANATIHNATLQLFGSNTGSTDFPITVHRLNASWHESIVNWNTLPAMVCCYGTTEAGSVSNHWVSWDITELVSGWMAGDFHNFGIALRGPDSGVFTHIFNSRENSTNKPRLVVTYSVPTLPGLNFQAQAIEVTQAVHGDIPTRIPPDGSLNLIENMVHVAGRRTVVRVYPWVSGVSSGELSPPITAQLYSSRSPSVPINPVNRYLRVNPDWTINEMRADKNKSWNFILPPRWHEEGTISLTVVINPAGAAHQTECPGCDGDNTLRLSNVRFVPVQSQNILMHFYLADFYERDESGAVVNQAATVEDAVNVFAYMRKTWPIADRSLPGFSFRITQISSTLASPPITSPPPWDNQVYLDEMAHLIRPGTNPYLYIPLLFSTRSSIGCSGGAGIGFPPLFHSGACGSTFAHEAAHTLGYNHASNAHGEAGGGPVDLAFPGAHGEIEPNVYGFDTWSIAAVPPTLGDRHTHDFMSYGGSPEWISMYTWNKLIRSFRTPPPSLTIASEDVAMANYLRFSGKIKAGAAQIDPVFSLNLPDGSHDHFGSGSYRIQLLGSDDSLLFTRNFEAQSFDHAVHDTYDFYELLPDVPGLAKIVIRFGEDILASKTVSPNAPIVNILSPTSGTQWDRPGLAAVAWQASDPDGDQLIFRVEGSSNGEYWHILVGDTTETQAELDLSALPAAGGSWKIRVRASDGIHIGQDEVSPIIITPMAPTPVILTPPNGAYFPSHQPIELSGQEAQWLNEDMDDVELEWFLNGAFIGIGHDLEIEGQPAGVYFLELKATNSSGLSSIASIQFYIDVPDSSIYLPLIFR